MPKSSAGALRAAREIMFESLGPNPISSMAAIIDRETGLPEALEALEAAIDWMDKDGCDCGVMDPPCALCVARAAIAKAKGEA